MSSPSTGPELDRRRLTAAAIDLIVPLAGVAATTLAGLSLTRGMLLVILGWTLYYFFALESGDGQTLGKRAMNLRVVSTDGGQPTMEQIAKRTLVRVVDGPIVGLIAMLATGERRARVGDIVAGTVVTDAGSPAPVDADSERRDFEQDPDPVAAAESQPYAEPEPAPPVAAAPDAYARLQDMPEYSVEEVAPDLPEYSVEEVHEDPPLEPSYVQTGGVESGAEPSTPTVRSVEAVSAIDLVMEASDRERPPVD